MKKILLLALPLLICSCERAEEDVQTQQVVFSIDALTENSSPMSRATVSEAALTDIYVSEGSTLLKHQVSTESDFGTMTLNLAYGSHALTFIASAATGQSWSDSQWHCTKVADTFAKDSTIAINGSSNNISVELPRRVAKVMFTTTDKLPATVSKVHLTVDNQLALDKDLKGADPVTFEATVDVSAKQGKTYSVSTFVLPESATEEEDCAVMIEFLSSAGSALYHYERTLKVKANRQTNLTGAYFTAGSNLVSVNTTWDTQVDTPLFNLP